LRREVDWVNFLDSDDYIWQVRVWREAVARAIGRSEEEAAEHALLFMNLPYFRKSRFFPAVDIAVLRAFKPDMLLTLIEEAHVIWRRIQLREEREKTGARLRLKDVFDWCTASILIGDTVAKALGVPNMVVAVKHPVRTIYGIALRGARPRLYLSFPINLVRGDPVARREIDKFRAAMQGRFYAFDPLTMDERVLRTARRRGEVRVVEAGDRWLLPDGVRPAVEDEPELYPMEIPADQVEEVLADIDNLIKFKDFRYILQSAAVAVYRPFMRRLFHRGSSAKSCTPQTRHIKDLSSTGPPKTKCPGWTRPSTPAWAPWRKTWTASFSNLRSLRPVSQPCDEFRNPVAASDLHKPSFLVEDVQHIFVCKRDVEHLNVPGPSRGLPSHQVSFHVFLNADSYKPFS
jgi:adenylate kinase